MQNNQGWIKLHRKLTDNPLWLKEPFTAGQAWVDLILLANHKSGVIWKRGIMISVKRGQVGHSEKDTGRKMALVAQSRKSFLP